MRYAVYFTPPPDAPLTQAAARWLGRDAFSEQRPAPLPGLWPSPDEIVAATAEPRRYGFHATLKAPFRLAPGRTEDGLAAALEAFCAARHPFTGPRLKLETLDGFIALVPAAPSAALARLEAEVVAAFEPFRAALTEAEVARRRPETLSPAQRQNLLRWGYPYVNDEFRFHMTLTGRLSQADAPRFLEALATRFGPLLDPPLEVGALALFAEPRPGAPFAVRAFARFGRP